MAEPTKKEKIKHTIDELKEMAKRIEEMAGLFEDHIKELEREIENNERNGCKIDDKTEK